MRRLLIVLVAAALVVAAPVAAHPKDSASVSTLEARVAALEARVAALEAAQPSPTPAPTPVPTPDPTPAPACTATVPASGSIQAAVDGAAAGATVCLTSGATYTLTSSVRIADKTSLTLDGQGATIRAASYFTSGTAEIVYVAGGSAITFRDLTILGTDAERGYQPGPEFQAGVAFAGTQGALVERVTVRNVQGDGVGAYARAGVPVRDLTVRNSTIVAAGRWGVTLTHAERVAIEANTVTDTDKAFELEPDPATPAHYVRDVLIRGNTVTGIGYNLLAAYGPGLIERITVEANRVLAGPNRGIWSYVEPVGFRAASITFRDNVGEQEFWEDPCATPCRAVLRLYRTDGATVTGNTQPVTPGFGMVGVLAEDSTNVVESGNAWPGT